MLWRGGRTTLTSSLAPRWVGAFYWPYLPLPKVWPGTAGLAIWNQTVFYPETQGQVRGLLEEALKEQAAALEENQEGMEEVLLLLLLLPPTASPGADQGAGQEDDRPAAGTVRGAGVHAQEGRLLQGRLQDGCRQGSEETSQGAGGGEAPAPATVTDLP